MVQFEVDKQEDQEDETSYSSSPSFRFRWDVFLSFRGEDTRRHFTKSLYRKLLENGIRTFHDESLERGEEIHSSLLTAIEDSASSIAVISENYATSRWCLEELAKILDCRRFLIPVFYGVDPSDVKNQKGTFEKAFRNHEQRFGQDSDKVGRWKKALEKAGGIPGWESRNLEESQLIQSLVKKILTKLSNPPLGLAKHPIGINSRVQEVLKLLDVESNGVHVVGFHGMGGIGKTTLAKAVYNRIAAQFEHCSFISDIRETSKKRNGLIYLQNKLIRNLFSDANSSVNEIGKGITKIKERIHEKRVLVVLDDVDDVSQLDALAGNKDWYHEGSRIIITTRDSKVLMQQLVTEMYEVKELSSIESLQLFSFYAFGREKPIETFMHLSEEVVSLIGHLPLVLEVLGAFFFDKRGMKEWEDGLEKLKQISTGNPHDVLKFSFYELDEQEKCIFLDIACFFAGTEMKREDTIDVLRGCGFNAEIAISVLTARSLIKVIHDNTLWMHDQIRDMGREIVREESLGDPCMQSRLWDHDEIMDLLKNKKGTRRIQGIVLNVAKSGTKSERRRGTSTIINRDMSIFTPAITYLKEKFSFDGEVEKEKEINLCTIPFGPMVNLRLLQINHINLEGNFKLIPNELKWLQWKECPLDALPYDFRPSELAVLDLTESKIKQVWDQRWRRGSKFAVKLKVLNLSCCYNLIATPDFSGHPHLEKLILERCTSLVEIHKSIGDVRTLTLLNLKNCSNLAGLPDDVSGLTCLENLILSGCSKLKKLPKNLSSMKSLINLLADNTALEELPHSIFRLKKLERLNLNGCTSLKQLPNSIGLLRSLTKLSLNHSGLVELPDSIGSLTNLETLSLMGCRSIASIPDSVGNLKSLLELFVDGSSIKTLPASIGSLSHLKHS